MSHIKTTTWPIDPHTEAKLAILKRYLDAWLPIMSRSNEKIIYIDGFAGPGEYTGGVDGSPLIAVKAVINHSLKLCPEINMIFIEKDPSRAKNLERKIALISKPKNLKTQIINKTFEETLSEILNLLKAANKRLAPSFVFIDPFGFTGIPIDLIKQIMFFEKCEVLINFMYEDLNRFISDKKLWVELTKTFGTKEWKKALLIKDSKDRQKYLYSLYSDQLSCGKAAAKHIQSYRMVNRFNKTDYFLFFATNHILGLKKMKESMWKIDPSGNYTFSDYSYDYNQPVLLNLKPDYKKLQKMILNKFAGKEVSIRELEQFVIVETPFRETHYKKTILVPLEKHDPPLVSRACAHCRNKGKSCRRFTYGNPRCILKFSAI